MSDQNQRWNLQGHLGPGRSYLIPISSSPFLIGRDPECALTLASKDVSRHHAEIIIEEAYLILRDLDSTNGTFLNLQRLSRQRVVLSGGDVIHFGSIEFRVIDQQSDLAEAGESTGIATSGTLSNQFVSARYEFDELLSSALIRPHYQKVVRLRDSSEIGYELLGRGAHPALPESPGPLFAMAEKLGKAVQLSELFRHQGVVTGEPLLSRGLLFVNTHPDEMRFEPLNEHLRSLRRLAPSSTLVLELHEKAITDLTLIRSLRATLDELEISLAYDDFGAGQARLRELLSTPPDYLKFDIALIRDIHKKTLATRRLLESLIELASQLGAVTLAEGIECEEEAEVCRELGFEMAQGYLFGRPLPLEQVIEQGGGAFEVTEEAGDDDEEAGRST